MSISHIIFLTFRQEKATFRLRIMNMVKLTESKPFSMEMRAIVESTCCNGGSAPKQPKPVKEKKEKPKKEKKPKKDGEAAAAEPKDKEKEKDAKPSGKDKDKEAKGSKPTAFQVNNPFYMQAYCYVLLCIRAKFRQSS